MLIDVQRSLSRRRSFGEKGERCIEWLEQSSVGGGHHEAGGHKRRTPTRTAQFALVQGRQEDVTVVTIEGDRFTQRKEHARKIRLRYRRWPNAPASSEINGAFVPRVAIASI